MKKPKICFNRRHQLSQLNDAARLFNQLVLTATVQSEGPLRYTPAGFAVLEIWLEHSSQQYEAGFERTVNCTIQGILVGEMASRFVGTLAGQCIKIAGFLCQYSQRNPRLVLHITHAEFVKG